MPFSIADVTFCFEVPVQQMHMDGSRQVWLAGDTVYAQLNRQVARAWGLVELIVLSVEETTCGWKYCLYEPASLPDNNILLCYCDIARWRSPFECCLLEVVAREGEIDWVYGSGLGGLSVNIITTDASEPAAPEFYTIEGYDNIRLRYIAGVSYLPVNGSDQVLNWLPAQVNIPGSAVLEATVAPPLIVTLQTAPGSSARTARSDGTVVNSLTNAFFTSNQAGSPVSGQATGGPVQWVEPKGVLPTTGHFTVYVAFTQSTPGYATLWKIGVPSGTPGGGMELRIRDNAAHLYSSASIDLISANSFPANGVTIIAVRVSNIRTEMRINYGPWSYVIADRRITSPISGDQWLNPRILSTIFGDLNASLGLAGLEIIIKDGFDGDAAVNSVMYQMQTKYGVTLS